MLTAGGMCLALIFRDGTGFLWSLLFLPLLDVLTFMYLVTQ